MNEYEHLFTQDCREKKRTASGARHRATRGKRSFTVHNPSDYLTKKQREELSSPVISFTAKPVTYEEFKAMSDDQKKAYLNFIIKEYAFSISAIAAMMGVCFPTIGKYIKKFGIIVTPKYRLTKKEKERQNQFLNRLTPPREVEINEEPTEPIEEPAEEPTEESPKEPAENHQDLAMFTTINSVTISGDNKDTLADDLRRALTFVLPDHKTYKITIETI